MFHNVLAAATTCTFLVFTFPAFAAPFVDIRASWSAAPSEIFTLPEGLTVSCRGDASGGISGCSNTISLNRTITESGTYAVSSSGSLVLTNTSNQAINGFAAVNIFYSAFNPGGPAAGISIDDAFAQGAKFESSVSGATSDFQSCSVGVFGESGAVYSSTSCGVNAPDTSEAASFVELINFLPGAEALFSFALDISATFDLGEEPVEGVPEPASALLILGLGALAIRRRTGRQAV